MVSQILSAKQFGNWEFPIWKHADDLRRYEIIFKDTKPDVLIECGTNNGTFANFVKTIYDVDVITIDIDSSRLTVNNQDITYLNGNSVNPNIVTQVGNMLDSEQRVMVSLDSDHSEDHVAKEIELYHKFVTPGCYLVVEDGIIKAVELIDHDRWVAHGCHEYNFNVVPAIKKSKFLRQFELDQELENLTEITMNPFGWLKRTI